MPHKTKKALGLISIVKSVAFSYLKRINNIAHLASLEARLARRTIAIITVMVLLLGFLLISTWVSLLLLLFIYIVSLHYSLLVAATVILILNIFLLLIVYLYIMKIKKNLFFPATRKQLANMGLISKD